MNRKELFMKKRKIATILLAACLLLGNVSVANAASIDNGNKVHFNTEDNDTDLTLLQSEFVERFLELSLFYGLSSPLNSEMICIFPYF